MFVDNIALLGMAGPMNAQNMVVMGVGSNVIPEKLQTLAAQLTNQSVATVRESFQNLFPSETPGAIVTPTYVAGKDVTGKKGIS